MFATLVSLSLASVAPGDVKEKISITPGVSSERILFGQSAAFSGPAAELGKSMRSGILAAFKEKNDSGGVNGRRLEL